MPKKGKVVVTTHCKGGQVRIVALTRGSRCAMGWGTKHCCVRALISDLSGRVPARQGHFFGRSSNLCPFLLGGHCVECTYQEVNNFMRPNEGQHLRLSTRDTASDTWFWYPVEGKQ